MERLTKRVKNESDDYVCLPDCEKGCVHGWLKGEEGCRCEKFGELLVRLCQIEDILGDTYDLDRLEVMMNQCMSMREEVYERFRITGSIQVDRLRELVEANKDGRCVVIPDFVWKIGETKGVIKVPYKSWMGRFIGTKFYKTEKEAAEAALAKEKNK